MPQTNKSYMHVQVVYRQGLVKEYLAGDILLEAFMKVVRAEGKVKTVRFLPDVDQATADLLVNTGNAVGINLKGAV